MRAHDPGTNRRLNDARHLPHAHRFNHGPTASAFLPSLIGNQIHHILTGLWIFGRQDLPGDFNEIAFQRATVPAAKDRRNIAGRKTRAVAHHAIDLGYHLHIGVFDPVVDSFYKMPSPVGSQMRHAGITLVAGCNRLENRRYTAVARAGASHHHGRPPPRAFSATRDPNPQIAQPSVFKRFGSDHRVAKI